MDVYTVLVVEDHKHTRERLTHTINHHQKLRVMSAVGTCARALKYLHERNRPHVMLVDLGLPDGNGIDLIRESQLTSPSPEVMVITVFGDEQHVVSAIEAGATGYLLKDSEPDFIAEAIMQLIQGGSPISSAIARHVLKRFQQSQTQFNHAQPFEPKLTNRELEVLNLVTKGFTNEEIATLLTMSFHTVTTHIKHIYRKLAVKSRSEAVFEAVQLGLVKIRK